MKDNALRLEDKVDDILIMAGVSVKSTRDIYTSQILALFKPMGEEEIKEIVMDTMARVNKEPREVYLLQAEHIASALSNKISGGECKHEWEIFYKCEYTNPKVAILRCNKCGASKQTALQPQNNIEELIEALKLAESYLEIDGEMKSVAAVYIPPAQALRNAADRIEAKEKNIRYIRSIIEKFSAEKRKTASQH